MPYDQPIRDRAHVKGIADAMSAQCFPITVPDVSIAMGGTSSPGDREIVKQSSFALIDDSGQAGERLYAVIPKVREHLAAVKESLAEAFPLPEAQNDAEAEEAFGGPAVKPVGGSLPRSDLALVREMKKDAESIRKSREVVIEAIRSQDEQSKERDAADFLFKTLKKANALVQNASGHGLRPESACEGITSQIESMRAALTRIEDWLAEKRA